MYSECDPWTYTSVGVTSTLQAMQRPIGKAVPLIADGTPVLYNPYVWVPSDTVSSLSTAGEAHLPRGKGGASEEDRVRGKAGRE